MTGHTFQTTNEVIYGSKLHERTQAEQMDLMANCKTALAEPEFGKIRDNVDRVKSFGIKNFGQESIIELYGCLGVFLFQFGDRMIDGISAERKRRRALGK